MLSSLTIENIAIIEAAQMDFCPGLNVLSGETGAGKSIVIDALSAVLGERTSKDLIRTGASGATVVALFEQVSDDTLEALQQLGLSVPPDRALQISRSIREDGRNICKINGTPVTVTMLKTIGKTLISIHGQHDSQNLLNPEYHYQYLDALGGLEPIHQEYLKEYEAYSRLYRNFRQLESGAEERRRRIETLQFEVQELQAAQLTVGEYDELKKKRDFFRNAEKVLDGLHRAEAALTDGEETNGALTLLFDVVNALQGPAGHLEEASALLQEANDLAYAAQDLKGHIETILLQADYNPQQQAAVEERLSLLHQLQLKYGPDEESMLSYLAEAEEELQSLQSLGTNREEVLAELEQRKEQLLAAADRLHLARSHAASDFEVRVQKELQFLDMPHVELSTSFTRCKLNPTGSDQIEFLISPNPGEALKPLAKIASGGELSRILLAIQNVLSDKGNVATLIFDEIDTGVSGSAAEKIAIKLKAVSARHQAICITHSAQVAAYAEAHFFLYKEVQDGKTYTRVQPLDTNGRIKELARIMGGVEITDLQKESAKELLQHAKNAVAT